MFKFKVERAFKGKTLAVKYTDNLFSAYDWITRNTLCSDISGVQYIITVLKELIYGELS